jgi:hypothetical protein
MAAASVSLSRAAKPRAGGSGLKFFWTVCIRLPAQLHKSLKQAARRNHVALSTEIMDRLLSSVEHRP